MKFVKIMAIIATVFLAISLTILLSFSLINSENSNPKKERKTKQESDSQIVNFLGESSFYLGSNEDNEHYALVSTMQMGVVAIKKHNTEPKVEYYIAPEGAAPNNYLVSNKLKQEDLSYFVTDEFRKNNSEFVDSREDFVFTVIDLDKDVMKSAEDFSRDVGNGILAAFGILILYGLAYMGLGVAAILYLIAFVAFLKEG